MSFMFLGSVVRRIGSSLLAVVVITAMLTAAVGPAQAQEADPIKVVATFSILADWVQQVGGDAIELTTIVPAGGDAHTFDPNPEQVARIADADIIFEIGVDFETWLDDMYDASGSSATRVAVSDGIELLSFDGEHEHAEDEEHQDDGEEGHDHGEHDPHIWGDVANAIHAVEIINQRLDEIDSANAATYDANAAAYTGQLDDLNGTIEAATQAIPEEQRKLVTTHDTFGYYAHAYGFEIAGTALNSLSTEGGDPPASDIADLVSAIQGAGVPAIFAENVSNSDLMEVIADEAGVELAPPLYTDALGEPGSEGDTYIDMMTYNTGVIVAALSGG